MPRKKFPTRPLSVRVPAELYDLLARVATARRTDVSVVVNDLLVREAPVLRAFLEAHEGPPGSARFLAEMERDCGPAFGAAMREAVASAPSFGLIAGESREELARRAAAHRAAVLRVAAKVGKRHGADAARLAEVVLGAQGLAGSEASMALAASKRKEE